ncbi:PIN domain-containing protein [Salinicoccus roseus]|uniref:PIN domain-containing protein n=1 Tax=Salinicoccus roseus TaxID=45670 RepID=UPI002301C66E|nr:PIN domain-containing protein [Salinicoccus roseus]
MYKILIDTCVWLDLAKDYQQQATLDALEESIQQGKVELILPRTIIDEFERNKDRIVEQSGRSLSSTLKRVKKVIDKFGDPEQKMDVITQLNDVDHRLPMLGEAAADMVNQIERLFSSTPIIEISDAVKIRSAQRAIDKRAPFHRQRNGIGDAILIEVYADAVREKEVVENRYVFISHNTHDFSHQEKNNKLPHPDIEEYFSSTKSFYFITLGEALKYIQPEEFDDLMIEYNWLEEPRRLTEIIEAIEELGTKVWYNRHQVLREKVEEGIIQIVEEENFPIKSHSTRPIQRDIWEGALRAAEKVEEKYDSEELIPWDEFEWGMINGKLTALRWVLGDEWDMLDT